MSRPKNEHYQWSSALDRGCQFHWSSAPDWKDDQMKQKRHFHKCDQCTWTTDTKPQHQPYCSLSIEGETLRVQGLYNLTVLLALNPVHSVAPVCYLTTELGTVREATPADDTDLCHQVYNNRQWYCTEPAMINASKSWHQWNNLQYATMSGKLSWF